ncbi:MAG: adenylyl-sulfate kinase [Thermoleophilia bacterium]|nr:adenylyl-sulfate kinase [Thermoleophilia bacterium]
MTSADTRPRGFTVWLTGLSGAGKSTVAHLVADELERRGVLVERLDGDVVRTHLSRGLGYSQEDRDTNIERIGWVASRLARAGVAVVVSAISPYVATRAKARAMTEAFAPFLEVYVQASVEECTRRDVKGLYKRALAGEIPDFTGVSAPYEPPEAPEVVLDTERLGPAESAARVIAVLAERGLVDGA